MAFTLTALRISSGILVWGVHFGVVYGLTALACARGAAASVPWIIGIATLVAGAAAAALIVLEWRHRDAFPSWLAATIAGFALVAILFEGVPVLFVPPCA